MNRDLLIKIIIILVIMLIIFVVIFNFNRKVDTIDPVATPIEEFRNETKGKLVKIDNLSQLYLVKNCIQKYYSNYCAINAIKNYSEEKNSNNAAIQVTEEKNRNEEYFRISTYSMLANDYIQKYGITKENIDVSSNGFEDVNVEIYDLYYLTQYENVFAYFTNGIIRDTINNQGIEFNYIVVVDDANQTFEIYLDNYIENSDFSTLVEGDEIGFTIPTQVENRIYNTYSIVSVKYAQAVQDTFHSIRRILLYDKEKAYELLTDSMKNKYSSYSDFENYLNNNNKIFTLTYGSYNLKAGENGTIYEIYNSDSSIRITVYFDGLSSFKFDLEELH